MGERTLSIAVAGAGLMGEWHARYGRRAGAELIAVVDPDRSRHSPTRFGNTRFFESLGSMLNEAKPRAVHLCTPSGMHVSQCEQLLRQGIHVLCEKPVGESLSDVEKLIALAGENGASIVPVHQFVFQRGVQRARSELERLGELLEVEVILHTAGGEGRDDHGLRMLMGEVLPHPLSLLELFGVLPLDGWVVESRRAGELRARGNHGNVAVSVSISAHARPTKAVMQLTGTAATVLIDLFHGFRVLTPGNVSRGRKVRAPFTESSKRFSAAAWNLGMRALRREPAYPGLLDLIRAFYKSIGQGGPLPIAYGSFLNVSRARDRLLGSERP
ncbi:MAG TPA: Gfo/Idh/MocA family oxidoreductase [Thermoanaerobaculia bacterium]|nr:Gfo/Idh/MocA family oxidoreductase [Thermoanaerobaculia bacterium]